MSNLHEAQSAVHVQLKPSKPHTQSKPSKQRNQRRQKQKETAGDGRVKGQDPTMKQTTNYPLHNPFSHSVSPPPQSLLLSVTLAVTDKSATHRRQQSMRNKISNLPGNRGSSEKAEVKRRLLREFFNCERELLCRMWGGRLFQTRGA